MNAQDFDYQVTYPESENMDTLPCYKAEPSLRELVRKYYSAHMTTFEAMEYTERYIAQMLSERGQQ